MDRAELKQWILENYHTEPDHPWQEYPHYEVFRHRSNRKWFALIMDVPKNKLGLPGSDRLDVVNFKCDALLVGSLRCEPGFFSRVPHEQGKLDHGRFGRQRPGGENQNAALCKL